MPSNIGLAIEFGKPLGNCDFTLPTAPSILSIISPGGITAVLQDPSMEPALRARPAASKYGPGSLDVSWQGSCHYLRNALDGPVTTLFLPVLLAVDCQDVLPVVERENIFVPFSQLSQYATNHERNAKWNKTR